MAALSLVFGIHFHHYTRTVIREVNGILLVQAYPYYIAFPADSLILVYPIEFVDGTLRVLKETSVSTVFAVVLPGEGGIDGSLLVVVP